MHRSAKICSMTTLHDWQEPEDGVRTAWGCSIPAGVQLRCRIGGCTSQDASSTFLGFRSCRITRACWCRYSMAAAMSEQRCAHRRQIRLLGAAAGRRMEHAASQCPPQVSPRRRTPSLCGFPVGQPLGSSGSCLHMLHSASTYAGSEHSHNAGVTLPWGSGPQKGSLAPLYPPHDSRRSTASKKLFSCCYRQLASRSHERVACTVQPGVPAQCWGA